MEYATPIRHASGSLAAAIHVSVIHACATKAHEFKPIPAALECASQVELSLGHLKPQRAAVAA